MLFGYQSWPMDKVSFGKKIRDVVVNEALVWKCCASDSYENFPFLYLVHLHHAAGVLAKTPPILQRKKAFSVASTQRMY